MFPLIVEGLDGKTLCRTAEELRAALSKTVNGVCADNINAFDIYQNPDKLYPYLSLLVRENYAYVWYAPNDASRSFQAYGEGAGLDPDGNTIFYISEQTYIWNRYISAKEKALRIILAFAALEVWPDSYEGLPGCAEWEEL